MLRTAPDRFVTMGELARIYQSHRAGARVYELNREGHRIEYVRKETWSESGYKMIFDTADTVPIPANKFKFGGAQLVFI